MRKTVEFSVTDEGRDKGKLFFIKEMPASQAERWAFRAFMGMSRSGVNVPDSVVSQGIAGWAQLGLQAISGMNYAEAEPLLQEMMDCVQIFPNPSDKRVMRALIEDDIEEIKTRLLLRREVFKLHTDFFTAAAQPMQTEEASNSAPSSTT